MRFTHPVNVLGTRILESEFMSTAFVNFMQVVKTIFVSTCFQNKHDLRSPSFACLTKKSFKFSNILCLTSISVSVSLNSILASVCLFQNMFCMLNVLLLSSVLFYHVFFVLSWSAGHAGPVIINDLSIFFP